MLLILISGSVAGMVHVLSGPDHLTAVAPLAMNNDRRGWLAGWTWGIGHSTGVVCVTLLAVLLRAWLPPLAVLSNLGERMVGVALIGVGIWAVRRSTSIGTAPHRHGADVHNHVYVRRGPAWLRRRGHAHASFYMGILHGVAGSAHFVGVLPALALPTATASALYIGSFAAGTLAAMSAFAAAVELVWNRLPHRTSPQRGLMFGSGIAALVMGTVWLVA